MASKAATKYIIVTGGVLSGLGKGVVAASIGRLLAQQYRIIPIKCDGYLNVDPGTMNPTEHGEVFVLEDGAEVDLDFGHYERFLNIDAKHDWSLTSGKIFSGLMDKERRGDFLGKTVQVIPHVTGEIRQEFQRIAKTEQADIMLIEIGGTVGDIENLWFLEACRELIRDVGRSNILFVHLGLIPVIDSQGQQKTKPIQQSITTLRERGIFPDIIIGRSKELLHEKTKQKLHWLCNVDIDSVISDPDLDSVYALPLVFEDERLRDVICKKLSLETFKDLKHWRELVHRIYHPSGEITIAICGKYTDLADSYLSVSEACIHTTAHTGVKIIITFIDTSNITNQQQAQDILAGVDGIIIPGGFGKRAIDGKLEVICYARENNIPFLGICYGLQLAVIEYARHVCGLQNANTTEIDEQTPHPVIDILPEQRVIVSKGATMRLGAYRAKLLKGSHVQKVYNDTHAIERHRHRYEVNPLYHEVLRSHGLVLSGMSQDETLVEFIELADHPYFVATQGHPELKSRMERPAPLFMGLVQSIIAKKSGQQPKIFK